MPRFHGLQRILLNELHNPCALPQHYPGRLKRLFLVGLPPDLAWVLDAQLRPLLHPATRAAIRTCPPGDPALPALPGLAPEEEDPPESPATPAGSLQNGTVRARSSRSCLQCGR